MKKLNFKENYNNKLNCDCFSTIRQKGKHDLIAGEVIEIYLDNEKLGEATVLEAGGYGEFGLVNEVYCYLDSGMNKYDFQELMTKFYGKDFDAFSEIDVFVLKWTNKN